MNQTEPEHPFDPDAATRLEARIGTRDLWDIEADLREVLRQLAYAKQTRHQLAEYCDRLRGQNADLHAQLDAVRAVTNEWHTFATGEGRRTDSDLTALAGHALAQVLRALDAEKAAG